MKSETKKSIKETLQDLGLCTAAIVIVFHINSKIANTTGDSNAGGAKTERNDMTNSARDTVSVRDSAKMSAIFNMQKTR